MSDTDNKVKKRPRKPITLEIKSEIIRLSNNGSRNIEICNKFNLSASTVATVLKDKVRILEDIKTLPKLSTKIRKRGGLIAEMENILIKWISEQNKLTHLTTKDVQAKAINIFEELKSNKIDSSSEDNFQASNGWFSRFQHRYNIQNIKDGGFEFLSHERTFLADSSSSSAAADHLPLPLPAIQHPLSQPILPTLPTPPAQVSVPKLVPKAPPKPPVPRAAPKPAPKPTPLNPRDLYNLQWSEYSTKFSGSFQTLWEAQDLVDVTLAVDGEYIQAHKLVLSVCSDYFRDLFRINPCQHPIVILRDMDFECTSALIHFMYCGEVQVTAEKLPNLLRIAQQLKVNGLNSEGDKQQQQQQQQQTTSTPKTPHFDTSSIPRLTPRITKAQSQPKPTPASSMSSNSAPPTTTGKKRTRYTIPSQVKVKVLRRNPPEIDEPQPCASFNTLSGDNTTFQQTNHNYISLPGTSKQDFQMYDHLETDTYNSNEHATSNIMETDLVEMIPIKLETDIPDTEPELHQFEFVSDVKEELGYVDEFNYETIEESESDHEGDGEGDPIEDADLGF